MKQKISINNMEYDWNEKELYRVDHDLFYPPNDEELEALVSILKKHYTTIKIISLLLEE